MDYSENVYKTALIIASTSSVKSLISFGVQDAYQKLDLLKEVAVPNEETYEDRLKSLCKFFIGMHLM